MKKSHGETRDSKSKLQEQQEHHNYACVYIVSDGAVAFFVTGQTNYLL